MPGLAPPSETRQPIPMLYLGYDLRHRRLSLLHLGGMPWARIGEIVGHGDVVTTARTYTHVVASEDELDYASLIA